MIDFVEGLKEISKLSALRFFPADRAGQKAVVEIVASMATDIEQVRWLVKRMLSLYNDWPGPKEMRAVFCSRFKPADGIEANTSTVFQDGEIPPATGVLAISYREQKALPEGHVVSADPELDAAVRRLGEMKRLR